MASDLDRPGRDRLREDRPSSADSSAGTRRE
jgi:hypothetical protein